VRHRWQFTESVQSEPPLPGPSGRLASWPTHLDRVGFRPGRPCGVPLRRARVAGADAEPTHAVRTAPGQGPRSDPLDGRYKSSSGCWDDVLSQATCLALVLLVASCLMAGAVGRAPTERVTPLSLAGHLSDTGAVRESGGRTGNANDGVGGSAEDATPTFSISPVSSTPGPVVQFNGTTTGGGLLGPQVYGSIAVDPRFNHSYAATFDPHDGDVYAVSSPFSSNGDNKPGGFLSGAVVNASDAQLVSDTVLNYGGYYQSCFMSTDDDIYVSSGSGIDPDNSSVGSNVTVYNELGAVVGTIPVDGARPLGIACDPQNGEVYVAATPGAGGSILVIEASNNTVIGSITSADMGQIYQLALDPHTEELWAPVYTNGSSWTHSNVNIINTTTNNVTALYSAGGLFANPQGIAYDPDTQDMWVSDVRANATFVINVSTLELVKIIHGGPGVTLTVDPSTDNVFGPTENGIFDSCHLYIDGCVDVFNGATDQWIGNITLGHYPEDAAVDPTNELVYVTNQISTNISVIQDANDTYDFTWNWGDGTSTGPSGGLRNPTHTYATAGTFEVVAWFNTSNGDPVAHYNLTIEPGVLSTTLTAGPHSFPIGGTTLLNVTVWGGTGSYRYSFSGLPKGCTNSSVVQLSCTPVALGHWNVTVAAGDDIGDRGRATVEVDVYATGPVLAPTPSFVALPAQVLQGHLLVVEVNVKEGTAPFQFCIQYRSGSSGPCAPIGPEVDRWFNLTPPIPGTWMVGVRVVDAAGYDRTTWENATVVAPLAPLRAIPTPSRTYNGSSLEFRLDWTGGLTPFSIWVNDTNFSRALCTSNRILLESSTCWATANWVGNHTIEATLRDAAGERTTISWYSNSYAAPSVTSLLGTAGPSNSSDPPFLVEAGAPVYLNASFAGGAPGPRYYAWTLEGVGDRLLGSGNGTAGNLDVVWTPEGLAPGQAVQVGFLVEDALGAMAQRSLSVTVLAGLSDLALSASPSTTDVNVTVNLTVAFHGGTGPFHFSLVEASTSPVTPLASSSAPYFDWTPTTPGIIPLEVVVGDVYHASATASLLLTVHSDPLTDCSPETTSTALKVGALVGFALQCVTGGTGRYTLSWSFGDGAGGSSFSDLAAHRYTDPGTYAVSVRLTDALGLTAVSRTLKVTIASLPPPAQNLNGGVEGVVWNSMVDSSVVLVGLIAISFGLFYRADKRDQARANSQRGRSRARRP
jgi:DNA-binding beta-propeller fold protein YncE